MHKPTEMKLDVPELAQGERLVDQMLHHQHISPSQWDAAARISIAVATTHLQRARHYQRIAERARSLGR